MKDIGTLIAGNWKMNGTRNSLAELSRIESGLAEFEVKSIEALICPPITLIHQAISHLGNSNLQIGAQDCHTQNSGAHTGDISSEMIAELGVKKIIAGHSERRTDHGESDKLVAAKAEAIWRAGCSAIICVGETQSEREAGQEFSIVENQLKHSMPSNANAENTIVAYEPVWAIGSGLVPSLADIEEMHNHIRVKLTKRFGDSANQIKLLYGGSVKPNNAAAILAIGNVNGALVGGASLKADDFLGIIKAAM